MNLSKQFCMNQTLVTIQKKFHLETTQIVIISENKFEIVGAVIKSPWLPNGIFFV